jgi:hypothetical protein
MSPRATLLAIVLASTVLLSTTAFAAYTNPPTPGTYKTLLGQVLPGRATESMPCDFCEGQVGNLIMAESWNGSALGTNWKVSCAQVASPPTLTYDDVDGSGYGQRIYRTTYTGGQLWLSGAGAWGGGDPFYTGPLTKFTVIVTKQYAAGQPVGAVSNINFGGPIDNYGDCFEMNISNAELVGATPGAPAVPGPFPPFMGPSDCDVGGSHGTYWDVHDITFTIYGPCVVPMRSSTWGEVKSIYR